MLYFRLMGKVHTLEDFYRNKIHQVPEGLMKGLEHFYVFRAEDFAQTPQQAAPYSRKDYYKISLIKGPMVYHYADKSIEVKQWGITFANPMIPYSMERLSEEHGGYFCVFTEDFLNQIPNVREYPVLRLGTFPIFELAEHEVEEFESLFEEMTTELNSEYAFKYDLLRALVQQVLHKAMKLKPNESMKPSRHSANERITSLFTELLERQFPIEEQEQRMKLRSPADFASHLSIHTNHLNRALKNVTDKTTSQLIGERVLQESKTLLMHSDWNVAEIGYSLGFDDPSHFISFFKKNTRVTPKVFRN